MRLSREASIGVGLVAAVVVLLALVVPSATRSSRALAQTTTTTSTLSVAANAGWTNTKLDVKAGKPFSIRANGTWTDGSSTVGPNGSTKAWPDNFFNLTDLGVCNVCARTNVKHWDALIGYIGNSPPAPGSYTSKVVLPEAKKIFYVGGSYSANAPGTGRLWLAMNADAYSGYTVDNSGQVTATVNQSPTPAKPLPVPQSIYAGYSASPSKGTVSYALANWKVPKVTCNPQTKFLNISQVAVWVGLWGPVQNGSSDNNWLPQAGTTSQCGKVGSFNHDVYHAVYEIYNAKHAKTGDVTLFDVKPGDSMFAQVEYAGPGTGAYKGKLRFWYDVYDNTSRQGNADYFYTTVNNVKLVNAAFQGGVIVEKVGGSWPLSGDLPKFSPITFTNVGVGQDLRDGPRNGLWTVYRWDMKNGKKTYATTGNVAPATFPVPEGHGSFTVTWANYK